MAAALLCLVAAARAGAPSRPPHPNRSRADTVHVQVEHSLFHPIESVTLQVERLDGRLVAQPGQIVSLDDRNSYTVEIDRGVTRLSAADLSMLLNSYLLGQAESAIRHVDVSFDGQQVVLKGEVHKLLTLPFSGRGALTATPAGEMRLHLDEFRVAGVLNKELLSLLGIHLDKAAAPARPGTFRVEGEDFIAPLSSLFPAPRVFGRVTRLHVEKQDLVQTIGIAATHHAVQTIPRLLPSPANYIYFTGGRMRFGKVTMDEVDLKLVDRTPGDAFDFSLDHYQQQIQAGWVKVLPSLGLVVYAADYATVREGAGRTPRPAAHN